MPHLPFLFPQSIKAQKSSQGIWSMNIEEPSIK